MNVDDRGMVVVNVKVAKAVVERLHTWRAHQEEKTRCKVSLASAFRAMLERGLDDTERRRGA